jgi:spermidine/putrescine transport system substrate-binding protein
VRESEISQASVRDLKGLINEASHGRISRRQFVVRALGLGLSAGTVGGLLAACGGGDGEAGPSASPTPMDTTKPEKLLLYNWSNYMTPDIKKGFKQKHGISIQETFFDDNEALLGKLKSGATGYDVIIPTNYMVQIMVHTGLLLPLDMKYIPNFSYVGEKFAKPSYDTWPDGKKYSVPYQWGTTALSVRTDKVPEEVTSWTTLWDERYKNQIDMLNDERDTPGVALRKNGYSINTTNQAELDRATDDLIVQKPLVLQYDSLNMKRNIIAGVALVMTWNGDCLLAMQAVGEDKVSYVFPTEGYSVWVDNMCNPVGSPSPYAAHLFMDYLCDPKVNADLTNWNQYSSPIPEADQYTNKFILDQLPTPEELERGEFLNDVGAFGRNYTEAWAKVKSA